VRQRIIFYLWAEDQNSCPVSSLNPAYGCCLGLHFFAELRRNPVNQSVLPLSTDPNKSAMNTTRVPLDQLNAASADDFVTALAGIYEHSPWVAAAVVDKRPFASLSALDAALAAAVRAAATTQRLNLIGLHPDLAGKAARAGALTAESTSEQGGAGLDRLSEEDYARFHQLNDAYRAKFRIPFIICVRRHTKDSILRQFERRLQNAPDAELDAALTEVCRIAALRLNDRVEAADALRVSGRLSTHVLDTHGGNPAEGVAVTLSELDDDDRRRLIVSAVTNHDGRTAAPLIGGRPVPTGRYELRFEVGAYYASRRTPTADPPFLQSVPVEFHVAEPEGHYHVPLLVTPWSFSTYRGS
jgi:2-oxo-4-hydroxy-4-carboxy-5-ureidoimidazoline decarboxylase